MTQTNMISDLARRPYQLDDPIMAFALCEYIFDRLFQLYSYLLKTTFTDELLYLIGEGAD